MSEKITSTPHQPMAGIDQLVRRDGLDTDNQNLSNRHSILVRRMRLLLPVAALCIIGVTMAVSGHETSLIPVPREQVIPQTASRNELVNPKFQSEDSNNHSYTITADRATQNAADMNSVHLEKPIANMELGNSSHVEINAQGGTYNQQAGNLDLKGAVEIHHDTGYELKTDSMNIDVAKKIMTSSSSVTGHGPAADITAAGMNADGNQKIVTFVGPAKLILRLNQAPQTTKDEQEEK